METQSGQLESQNVTSGSTDRVVTEEHGGNVNMKEVPLTPSFEKVATEHCHIPLNCFWVCTRTFMEDREHYVTTVRDRACIRAHCVPACEHLQRLANTNGV